MYGLWVNINKNPEIAFHIGDGPKWWMIFRKWLYLKFYPKDAAWLSKIVKEEKCQN